MGEGLECSWVKSRKKVRRRPNFATVSTIQTIRGRTAFPTSVQENPVLFADKVGGDYSLHPTSAGATLGESIALEALADSDC